MNYMNAILVSVGIIWQLVGSMVMAQNRSMGEEAIRPFSSRTTTITQRHLPESLSELLASSPDVIVATCEGELPARLSVRDDPRSDLVTDRLLRVDRVLKGKIAPKKQIVVQELGGIMHDGQRVTKQVINGQNPIQVRSKYLLFLRPLPDVTHDRFDGNRYSITAIWAGSFHLINGRIRLSDAVGQGLRELEALTEVEVLERVRIAASR